MLFGAVSATLTEFAANPRWLGGMPAFSLVLHTWKQDLGRHVHIHALMAGGALSATGEWTAAKRGFLFPVKALSKVFRGKFVAALKLARDNGKLPGPWLADAGVAAICSRGCMPMTGWSMPSNRWAGRRRCWSIWGAIRIGWRSRTSASWAWTRTR